ncbi:type III secretion system export apparatus subunit SctT [Serratia silvae]
MALVMARIMPAFMILPFLNNSVLTGAIRMPVAGLIGAALWPGEVSSIAWSGQEGMLLFLVVKELAIGLFIGLFLVFPIWVMHAAGSIIDNQRGATLSSNMDPVSGVDTSELANLFNLFAAVVVLQSGGMLLLLEVFEQSYKLWPPQVLDFPSIKVLLPFIVKLVEAAIVLASPLVASFILTEILLGMLARYAPQLNAFSLALTVKSIVAFFLLILYFSPVFPDRIQSLQLLPEMMRSW